MIAVTDHVEGCVLAVKAQPGARRTGVVGEQAGALKVAVTAPPDQGKANKAVAAVLCDFFDLKKTQVELVAGPASRDKKFLLRGLTAEQARAKLQGGA